jgi:glycine/D-amino acid oxidase-like deaminating enzyme
MRVAVVGAGIFGLAASLALRERDHEVVLFERGRIPDERASSTDTSKTIRRLYGRNATYVALVDLSAARWRHWANRLNQAFYVHTGQLQIEGDFRPGRRIHDSWQFFHGLGADVQVLPIPEARRLYPQFAYEDSETCVYDPWGGYIASTAAMVGLAELAREAGVTVLEDSQVSDVSESSTAASVLVSSSRLSFDCVVVAAGVWIIRLVPTVGRYIRPTRQEMAFFEPIEGGFFTDGSMPVWAVNPETEGWYGHPLQREGWVKVANDLRGEIADPDSPRIPSAEFLDAARDFVARRMPRLANARLVGSRVCLYEDTPDRHFIIDWVPGSSRILVAGGGSGHAFKFGGSIGEVIADAVEHRANSLGDLFRLSGRFR